MGEKLASLGFLTSVGLLIKSRIEAIFVWSWCTAVSCLIVGRGTPALIPSLMSIVAMIFLSMSVYIYNDVVDSEMDVINPVKNSRPLPSGKVNKRDAMILVYSSAILGLTVIAITNIYSLIFAIIYLFLFSIYSHPKIHLKKRLMFKELIIALGWPLSSLVASYALINTYSFTALFAGIFFAIFAFMGMPALNDSIDIEQDKIQGVRSLALVLNWRSKIQLLILGVLIIMTLSPLTYINLEFNILLPILVVASSLVFLRYVFPVITDVEKSNIVESQKLVKAKRIAHLYFILLQIFTVIGSLNITIFNL